MPRRPRLRSLTLFLLREGIESWDEALRDPDSVERHETTQASGVDGVLVVGTHRRKRPWWLDFVSPHVLRAGDLENLFNSSTSALFLFEAGGRRFALTFGYGRFLLEPESYEHDFGLRVVLNTVEPDRIKSIDARTVDELTMHTRRNASRESSFEDFGVDVARDLVRAVSGPPRDESLARNVAGSDSLAISTRAQLDELPALCERLLQEYGSEEYRERFPWVDHLRPVKDARQLDQLNDALVADLREGRLDHVHLAPPEILDPQRLAGFDYSTRREGGLDTDPRISVYLRTLPGSEAISLRRLKSDRIEAYESEGEQLLGTWSVYRCLVYETYREQSERALFVLTGGDWYRVSTPFEQETVNFVNGLPALELELPDASVGTDEKTYNEEAATATGCLCLDRRLVRVEGRTPIELCDLLSRQRQLVHVKRRGSSSTLSHLFSQGAVSAQLLLSDEAFRRAAHELVNEVDESFADAVPEDPPRASDYEVGYVVITRATPQHQHPLTLPFFSLVNLSMTAKQLQVFGFKVAVRRVNEPA
jgi:uncharacterized protein (TIGR04141 family)